VLRGEPMKSEHTAKQVAMWMLEELNRQGKLHLDTVVFEIREKFGSQFTSDKYGSVAIRIDVLVAFRKLTKDFVVWVREDRYWRMREAHDGPGRLGV
jgi:hypothetical protein